MDINNFIEETRKIIIKKYHVSETKASDIIFNKIDEIFFYYEHAYSMDEVYNLI